MLILIHGSLGLDYLVHSVLPRIDWTYSTICSDTSNGQGIDVELDKGVGVRLAIMWSRVLGLRDGDSRLLLESLLNSRRLREAIDYVFDMHVNYDADRLYYFMKILSSLNIWRPINKGCIAIPLIEPIMSLVSSVILSYMVVNGVRGSIILSTDFIDELADALEEVRSLGNIYVFTNRLPHNVAIFDDLIITSTSIPQETFGKLIRVSNGGSTEVLMTRLGMSITNNNFEPVETKLSDVEMEILRTVNEFGFSIMNSLIDIVSQSTGVSSNDVVKALIKVSSMGLVEIRYLSDGRAIVTPTLAGLRLLVSK